MELKEFRPISLVEAFYKIVSKVLANRLKKMLGKIISDNQSAFIGGRQILDGVMLTNEIINSLKKCNQAGVVLKLDFKKAYDCVDWNFLNHVMELMGFGDRWKS